MGAQDVKNISPEKIDKNFSVKSNIEKDDIVW